MTRRCLRVANPAMLHRLSALPGRVNLFTSTMIHKALAPPLSQRRYTLSLVCFGLAPLTQMIETYLFADWQFLKFLLVLIALDTMLGVAWAWRTKTVSSRTFSRLLTKLFVYVAFLVLIHVLCHFTVEGVRSGLFAWLTSLAYGAILIREGISILENLVRLSPGTLPAWLVARLKAMDEQGKITDENTPSLS